MARLRILDRAREVAATPARPDALPGPRLARVAAGLAALSTVVGAGLVVVAVVSSRRLWFGGYVSEAGVGTDADGYRAGMAALGLGLVLLGVAVAATLPACALLLGGSGLLAGLSGSVSCSAGCPLPPYQSPTAGDLVHAAASILAVGTIVLAMIAIATVAADRALRRVSQVTAVVVVPLLVVMGIAMLAAGRGHLTGLLERAVLILATIWALATCACLIQSRPPQRRHAPVRAVTRN